MAGKGYLLGVDVGTTGAKAALTTLAGIVAQQVAEYGFLNPRPLRA